MKSIAVDDLLRAWTRILEEVELGEVYVVTRHDREIARLVPPEPARLVSPEGFQSLLRATPLASDWSAELKRSAADLEGGDP